MAEDATRKLLKVFGVSVTDCEDALAALRAAVAEPGAADPAAVGAALEAYGRAARELAARWQEVQRLILDYQVRAHDVLAAYVRVRSQS